MKMHIRPLILLFLILSGSISFAQSTSNDVDVTVFESVLNTASWANFKYKDQLIEAKKGDQKAISSLLDFSGTVDGSSALDHSVTLLELIVSAGDKPFAFAVIAAKPKLRSVLLNRLQLAQGRTQKEELRKPMADWAPQTWAALNNKPYVPKNTGEVPASKNPDFNTDPKYMQSQTHEAHPQAESAKPGNAHKNENPKNKQ